MPPEVREPGELLQPVAPDVHGVGLGAEGHGVVDGGEPQAAVGEGGGDEVGVPRQQGGDHAGPGAVDHVAPDAVSVTEAGNTNRKKKKVSTYPTTNGGMQNGSSVKIYIHVAYTFFACLAPICILSRRLLTKLLRRSSVWKFIEECAVLLVGYVGRGHPPAEVHPPGEVHVLLEDVEHLVEDPVESVLPGDVPDPVPGLRRRLPLPVGPAPQLAVAGLEGQPGDLLT